MTQPGIADQNQHKLEWLTRTNNTNWGGRPEAMTQPGIADQKQHKLEWLTRTNNTNWNG